MSGIDGVPVASNNTSYFMTSARKLSLTGIKPSGQLHIGNYLGAIRPALELQKQYDCIYFIADLHALTTLKDGKLLAEYSMDIVASWIALGLDVKKNLLFRQSDIPEVTEYCWYLSCFTPVAALEQAHAYKDAIAKSKSANHGLFAYPVLMAADILMYHPDVVPVGKDQKQHVEIARDIAGAINAHYSRPIIKVPESLINEKVMTIPGLDGRKMSKSYNNEIPLFAEEKLLRQKVMSIKSDSTPLEAPKELNGTLIGELYTLFGTEAQYNDLASRMAKGGMGWGHAKEELFVLINDHLKDYRAEYLRLRADVASLQSILADGAKRGRAIALKQLNHLREVLGVGAK